MVCGFTNKPDNTGDCGCHSRMQCIHLGVANNGREFGDSEHHPFELYLALNDIFRITKVKSPQINGFVECFNRTALDEFFRIAFRENFYESVKAFQKSQDRLAHYIIPMPEDTFYNNSLDWHKDVATCIRDAFTHYQQEPFENELLVREHLSKLWFLIISHFP